MTDERWKSREVLEMHGRQDNSDSDRRWIVLTEDGRYATIGRARDPGEDDIVRAEDGLKAQGLAGWLAAMSGTEYAKVTPTFLEVRPLGKPTSSFEDAVRACEAAIRSRRQ
jgi:hypothetical protein